MATSHAAGCELVRDLVARNGTAQVRVYGSSMLPSVWPGDIVQVRRTSAEKLTTGQIVLFGRNGALYAHRITAITRAPWAVITQGDHLPRADEPVSPAELIGAVVGITRRDRQIRVENSLSWKARLLRFLAGFSDLPTALLLRFHYGAARGAEPGSSAGNSPFGCSEPQVTTASPRNSIESCNSVS